MTKNERRLCRGRVCPFRAHPTAGTHAPKTQPPPAHVTCTRRLCCCCPMLSTLQQQMCPCQLGAQCRRQTPAADKIVGGCARAASRKTLTRSNPWRPALPHKKTTPPTQSGAEEWGRCPSSVQEPADRSAASHTSLMQTPTNDTNSKRPQES